MLDKRLLSSALEEIELLRTQLLSARDEVQDDHPRFQSLLNLRQYLILRSKKRTRLQEKLFTMSLSSLGRSYAHVAASIDTLYDQLSSSLQCKQISEEEMEAFHHLSITDAIATASSNSKQLFGGKTSSKLSKQSTGVMVTLPSHAAQNSGHLIRGLADAGVNVFRINTAHDDAKTWLKMADVIAQINEERDSRSKINIFVDLAGPKIRTGKIRKLDLPVIMGSNKREKEVFIRCKHEMTQPESIDAVTFQEIPAQIAVEESFFKMIIEKRLLKVVDTNGKNALITITSLSDHEARGILNRKIYLNTKSTIHQKQHTGTVRNLAKQSEPIRLFIDDKLIITEVEAEGHAAMRKPVEDGVKPALISCSFQGISSHISIGEQVFIDDGKIGLQVIEKREKAIVCRVIQAKRGGTLLKEEKGINFPDTYIETDALTDNDRMNLEHVINFADHLSLSFCQSAKDVKALQELLEEKGRSDIGIIAKIETKQAVSNMPEILEQLLLWEKSGVMIARGDLAIEVGFKNLAYMQEALLDICDAAHMPVIWATQVLESQMKNNLPSRAEITDAAMAGRAECVMLNKGAFATNTIDVLIHILDDMHSIFKKNRQLLKKETLW